MSNETQQTRHRSKQEYLRIFMQFDADNSGSVSKNQIVKMFKACEMEIDEDEAEDLMNQIDADGGGQLQQDEFIEFLKFQDERIQYSVEECRRMFNYFAHDKDGFIGFEQMKTMFISLGEKVSDSDISKMIIVADKNKDGKLDFTEFCKVIKEI